MKNCKAYMAIGLVVIICFGLCACGISKEQAVGTWSGTYVYNGNEFSRTFVLDADGNYSEICYKNGTLNSTESGTYEIENGDVLMHEYGNLGVTTRYEYKRGKLVNNGHEFTKQ